MTGIYFAATTACTSATGLGCATGLPKTLADQGNLSTLLSIVFAIFGALTVLMIVIGAMNFINSEGDPQKAARARNTVIYALVGLVVAILAEAIVTLVLGKF